jgi:hypothetical protein
MEFPGKYEENETDCDFLQSTVQKLSILRKKQLRIGICKSRPLSRNQLILLIALFGSYEAPCESILKTFIRNEISWKI